MPTHILTLSCPDRPGIVAAFAQRLLELEANILDNAQFGDPASSQFCMRTRFETVNDAVTVRDGLASLAAEFDAALHVRDELSRPRVLVMVSRLDHCLVDILQRWKANELPIDLVRVVSNHADLGALAVEAGVPFEHVPVTNATKPQAEARLDEIIAHDDVDLVVLARYMQILSAPFAARHHGRIINIHHSFLPGFKGARPYHQAWDRGVKLIGATAHFVTSELDEGPIIDQDVARVTHATSAEQMVVLGKDVERITLSRALKACAEGRVFLLGQRTVVFP